MIGAPAQKMFIWVIFEGDDKLPILLFRMDNKVGVKVMWITCIIRLDKRRKKLQTNSTSSCNIQYKTTASLLLLIYLRSRRSTVCLAPLSPSFCIPVSHSTHLEVIPWHQNPSFLIFFPATDLPKFQPPPLFLSLSLQKSLSSSNVSSLTLHQKVILQTCTPSWWDNEHVCWCSL